jgi:hypothetical protein
MPVAGIAHRKALMPPFANFAPKPRNFLNSILEVGCNHLDRRFALWQPKCNKNRTEETEG